jgi:hypothetical protein
MLYADVRRLTVPQRNGSLRLRPEPHPSDRFTNEIATLRPDRFAIPRNASRCSSRSEIRILAISIRQRISHRTRTVREAGTVCV